METDVPNLTWEPPLAERPNPFPWLNVILFLATGFTTLFMGTLFMVSFEQDPSFAPGGILQSMWQEPKTLLRGLPFSLAIMSILLAHEMGHYLTCRYYGISATLPYFIPAPTLVGTFGAFIRIRSPIQHKAALLDVGVAGPIAGFVLSVPILAVALAKPRYVNSESVDGLLSLGEPLIFKIVAFLMGVVPPPGMEPLLHPIGFAAWIGFLLTTLNLIPVGQLDGGHIAYALFGRFHKRISQLFSFCPVTPGHLLLARLDCVDFSPGPDGKSASSNIGRQSPSGAPSRRPGLGRPGNVCFVFYACSDVVLGACVAEGIVARKWGVAATCTFPELRP